jgi:hypothetical protein
MVERFPGKGDDEIEGFTLKRIETAEGHLSHYTPIPGFVADELQEPEADGAQIVASDDDGVEVSGGVASE